MALLGFAASTASLSLCVCLMLSPRSPDQFKDFGSGGASSVSSSVAFRNRFLLLLCFVWVAFQASVIQKIVFAFLRLSTTT